MKNALKPKLLLLFVLSFIVLISCKKELNYVEAIVEKNCSGEYIKVNDNFLLVCNKEKLTSFENGQKIKVAFQVIKKCDSYGAICAMAFAFKETVNINGIKK